MSFVIAAPEVMATAATDLANLGSTLSVANAAATAQTTRVLAAAEDEVSAAIAALISAHGQGYQALSAQAAPRPKREQRATVTDGPMLPVAFETFPRSRSTTSYRPAPPARRPAQRRQRRPPPGP